MDRVVADGLANPDGLYSHVTVAGDYCFVAGMIGQDEHGRLVDPSFAAQAERALSNSFTALVAAGFEKDDVAYVQVLLADIGDWPGFNAAWREAFPAGQRPARLAYQVAALPKNARVEVQMTAVRS